MKTCVKCKDLFKRGRNRNNGGIGFAAFLIVFGGVYLLLNTGIIPQMYKPVLISWQMLLIAIGVWSLLKRHYSEAAVLILIGGIFIYPKLSLLFPDFFIDIHFDFRTYWPVILIVIGLILILGKSSLQRRCRAKANYNYGNKENFSEYENVYNSDNEDATTGFSKADLINKDVIFGSSRQIVLSQNFRGGEGNVIFGELIIDLRKARLAKGSHVLKIDAAFAGTTVYVPSDWNVELQGSSVFGSFEDKRYSTGEETVDKSSLLVIKGNCIFGGGELKN